MTSRRQNGKDYSKMRKGWKKKRKKMRVKALKEENSFEGLITLVKSRTLLRKYYCFFYILQLSTISVAGCGLGEISGQNYLFMPQWEISRMIKFSFVLYIMWFCNQKFSWFFPFLRKFVLRKKRINLQFFFFLPKMKLLEMFTQNVF